MEGGIPPYLPNEMEMVHRNLITFFAAAMVCACAAVDEKDVQMPSGAAGDPMTKVVGLSEEVDGRTFLVKFDVPQDEASLKETGLRNGLSFSRLFRSTPGKEALEAEFGLDRWYVAALEGDVVLADAVSRMAEMSSVSLVQYNSIARKASDCVVYPFEDDEPDTKATASSFNDPDLKYQWHYDNQGNASIATTARKGADINVTDVWSELTCGDPSIIVAVVDEGVKHSHPDLKDNMWVNEGEIAGNGIDDDDNGYIDDVHGYNFVTDGPVEWTADGNSGHGTHCAGTIAAVNNNGVGVAGVAGGSGSNDGCRIMSCQIFSGREGGTVMQSVNAIKYAADMGASIISCSFGYTAAFPSDNAYIKSQGSAEIDAVHYFEACRNNTVLDGNIAIFASGNDAHDYAHYPGAFHDIISVTAFGPDNLPTHYTNYGPGCNIAAPGGEAYLPPWKSYKALVLSTVPSELVTNGEASSSKGNDYGYMQGTSMACPHVSGVVALALSYAKKIGKTFERDRFKDMIITSANDMDQYLKGTKSYVGRADLNLAPFYHKLGTGSLDAWLLMMQIEGIPSLTAEIGRKQWLDLSAYFGTASTSLTYLGLEVSDAGRESLGLAEEPYIEYGRLYIHPTKPGSAKITIKAVGGGDEVGGGDNVGGMEISQEVSVIARSFVSENGGWL